MAAPDAAASDSRAFEIQNDFAVRVRRHLLNRDRNAFVREVDRLRQRVLRDHDVQLDFVTHALDQRVCVHLLDLEAIELKLLASLPAGPESHGLGRQNDTGQRGARVDDRH